jgi:subtilisin family serine protease
VVDVNNLHGNRVKETARLVADAEAELSNSLRLYPDDVASAVSNFVSTGYRIIVVTTGTSPHTGVSNALRYAESSNALVFCAVPNAEVNIDVTPDYPSSWAHEISSIIPVTNTDRNGNLYNPGASAYGTNTLGAPGRRIVCDPGTGLVQWSGTSAATPMAAGVGSLLIKRFASQTSAAYRQALMASAHTITGTRRIDSIRALTIQEPHLSVNGNTLTVHGLTEWRYGLERSGDLQTWTVYTNVMGGQTMTVTPAGFYRAAVK